MELGKYNTLTAARYTSVGLFLEDEEGDDVLLPMKWVPKNVTEGEEVEVFIYLDSEERPIATTLKPKAVVGEFAYLQAKQVSRVGAFMDWGLEKDLFVPFLEQEKRMEPNHWYVVYLYVDKMTERIAASARIENYVKKNPKDLRVDQEVDLLIANQTPLGYKVIIDNQFLGLIYENEIFQEVSTGDKTKGYIKNIREDGKVDVRLQKAGFENIEPNAQRILEVLKSENGFLNLHDKSDPDQISERLQMSKKTFKKAIGTLYRQKLISMEEGGIRLI